MFMSCFMVINDSCSTNMCAWQLSFNFSSMVWGGHGPVAPPLDPPLLLVFYCSCWSDQIYHGHHEYHSWCSDCAVRTWTVMSRKYAVGDRCRPVAGKYNFWSAVLTMLAALPNGCLCSTSLHLHGFTTLFFHFALKSRQRPSQNQLDFFLSQGLPLVTISWTIFVHNFWVILLRN